MATKRNNVVDKIDLSLQPAELLKAFTEKDKATAIGVIEQIDDICTDNKLVLKHIRSVVAKKTHLKPRAGIKESDQNEYLELITKIDTRLSATGAFDEMLMQKLGIALRKKEEV